MELDFGIPSGKKRKNGDVDQAEDVGKDKGEAKSASRPGDKKSSQPTGDVATSKPPEQRDNPDCESKTQPSLQAGLLKFDPNPPTTQRPTNPLAANFPNDQIFQCLPSHIQSVLSSCQSASSNTVSPQHTLTPVDKKPLHEDDIRVLQAYLMQLMSESRNPFIVVRVFKQYLCQFDMRNVTGGTCGDQMDYYIKHWKLPSSSEDAMALRKARIGGKSSATKSSSNNDPCDIRIQDVPGVTRGSDNRFEPSAKTLQWIQNVMKNFKVQSEIWDFLDLMRGFFGDAVVDEVIQICQNDTSLSTTESLQGFILKSDKETILNALQQLTLPVELINDVEAEIGGDRKVKLNEKLSVEDVPGILKENDKLYPTFQTARWVQETIVEMLRCNISPDPFAKQIRDLLGRQVAEQMFPDIWAKQILSECGSFTVRAGSNDNPAAAPWFLVRWMEDIISSAGGSSHNLLMEYDPSRMASNKGHHQNGLDSSAAAAVVAKKFAGIIDRNAGRLISAAEAAMGNAEGGGGRGGRGGQMMMTGYDGEDGWRTSGSSGLLANENNGQGQSTMLNEQTMKSFFDEGWRSARNQSPAPQPMFVDDGYAGVGYPYYDDPAFMYGDFGPIDPGFYPSMDMDYGLPPHMMMPMMGADGDFPVSPTMSNRGRGAGGGRLGGAGGRGSVHSNRDRNESDRFPPSSYNKRSSTSKSVSSPVARPNNAKSGQSGYPVKTNK